MTELTSLNLHFNNRLTDEGLKNVGKLKSLQSLDLSDNSITDTGLSHLAALSKLSVIELADTKITGKALAHLGKMSGLRRLRLTKLPVKDDIPRQPFQAHRIATSRTVPYRRFRRTGLKHLKNLKKLQTLGLAMTFVGDDGMEHLTGLSDLRHLDLSKNQRITDKASRSFEKARQTANPRAPISTRDDAGLENLSGLTSLRFRRIQQRSVP